MIEFLRKENPVGLRITTRGIFVDIRTTVPNPIRRGGDWPKSVESFGIALKRAIPTIEADGFDVVREKRGSRFYTFIPRPEQGQNNNSHNDNVRPEQWYEELEA
jgi:hypothetical protein